MSHAILPRASIPAMLEANAARFGSRPAINDAAGTSLSHAEVRARVVAIAQALDQVGIGRGDRVALVLPAGPDSALIFIAVAACATSAPLNPAYLQEEFTSQLRDLSARALIVEQGSDSPALAAAKALDIPVMQIKSLAEGSELIGLPGTVPSAKASPSLAEAEDVALVLHTSGTTSRPKKVLLTHANLCTSASNIARTLQLRETDVAVSAMPLFHIHGLVCMLASLSAGGSYVCAPTFQPERFLGWVETWRATWFSAVPTALHGLLDLVRNRPVALPSLRLIRSSSASLPPVVMAALEEIFAVPVIESYGMTEASHQMASNPLPPGLRKPGSVGLPAGPDIAILDELGSFVSPGSTGEVCVKGNSITQGYEDNPEANVKAFCNGWFRTGDQGYFDDEGYLFLTGRLKEIINRGGEKIAPRKIDEALLAHPAVRLAVAFAVPHASLGEDIAAAVVLRPDAVCREEELRAFLLQRLPAFSVPSQIVTVKSLPLGPTGKLQRIGMAERLSDALTLVYEPPQAGMETLVAQTIAEVLGLAQVGRQDNFFTLGGDSLRGTRVLMQLEQSLGLVLPAPLLFRLPTPALLAGRVAELVASHEIDQIAADLSGHSFDEQLSLLEEASLTPDEDAAKEA